MNGLEKINSRIRRDASEDVEAILSQARQEADDIMAQYRAQADQITREAEARRGKMAADRLDRLQGSSEMACRQMLLGAKQACIDEAFFKASKAIRDIPREQYNEVVASMAARNGVGDEEIIVEADDAPYLEAIVQRANELKPGAHFRASQEQRFLGGGIVLKNGPVEINCSFASQLAALRQEMATDIAQVLFR